MRTFICSILLICSACYVQAADQLIRVLQFNIWQEGTMVPGGYEAIVDEIDRLNPDFVTFSEVRNYNDTRFFERIIASLAEKKKMYYSFLSDDSGLLSRYPISSHTKIFPDSGSQGGSIYKLVTKVGSRSISVYTAHLDYTHYAAYLSRGYDGFTWKKLPEPITDVDSILESNQTSLRDEALEVFIREAKKDLKAGRLVFIGGDFNEPSHRDWTEALKDSFDHRGCIVPWTSTIRLEKAGFVDSYREKYPDPATHPGFTYPADCRQADISKLAWAPDADDRDRIDFIFYYPDKKLQLTDCVIVGPQGSICRNQRIPENTDDVFVEPVGVWPTDHKAVMCTFKLIGN